MWSDLEWELDSEILILLLVSIIESILYWFCYWVCWVLTGSLWQSPPLLSSVCYLITPRRKYFITLLCCFSWITAEATVPHTNASSCRNEDASDLSLSIQVWTHSWQEQRWNQHKDSCDRHSDPTSENKQVETEAAAGLISLKFRVSLGWASSVRSAYSIICFYLCIYY